MFSFRGNQNLERTGKEEGSQKQLEREKAALMSKEDLAAQVVPYVVRNKRVRKAKGKKAGKAPLSKIKSKLKLKVGLTGAKLTAAAKKKKKNYSSRKLWRRKRKKRR